MVEPTMPVVYFFAYFLLEALAFWAVSSWIGVGWALLVLFVTMFFGMTIAGVEARRIMRSRVRADDKGQLVYSDDKPGRTDAVAYPHGAGRAHVPRHRTDGHARLRGNSDGTKPHLVRAVHVRSPVAAWGARLLPRLSSQAGPR